MYWAATQYTCESISLTNEKGKPTMNNGTQKDSNKATIFNASANAIHFEQIQLSSNGLHIPQALLAHLHASSTENAENSGSAEISENSQSAMMMVKQGEILLVTDPTRMSLMRSAEELQFRQDELKEDHSNGILAIVERLS